MHLTDVTTQIMEGPQMNYIQTEADGQMKFSTERSKFLMIPSLKDLITLVHQLRHQSQVETYIALEEL